MSEKLDPKIDPDAPLLRGEFKMFMDQARVICKYVDTKGRLLYDRKCAIVPRLEDDLIFEDKEYTVISVVWREWDKPIPEVKVILEEIPF